MSGIARVVALILGATASAGVAIAVGAATARRRQQQHYHRRRAPPPPVAAALLLPRRPLPPVMMAAAMGAAAAATIPAVVAATDGGGGGCTMCKRPITAVTGSRLRCGHVFHDACVAAWPTHFCPVCRRQETPMPSAPPQLLGGGGAATGSVVSLMDF